MEDKIKRVNSGLIKAMEAMKADDNKKTRTVFAQELVNCKMIIPTIIKPAPVDGKIAKGSVMSFFSVRTKDKENVLFLFTSIEELQKWAPAEGKHLILQNYQQFKTFLTGKNTQYDGLVIDPCGAEIVIKKGFIDKIDAALKPMSVKNERIRVESDGLQPAELASPGLYAALSEAMERDESVNAAWMMQAQQEGSKIPTTVLVVDFIKGGDIKNSFNALARCANDFLAPGESIGMMPAYDKAAFKSIRNVEPFYIKNKRGVWKAGSDKTEKTEE